MKIKGTSLDLDLSVARFHKEILDLDLHSIPKVTQVLTNAVNLSTLPL